MPPEPELETKSGLITWIFVAVLVLAGLFFIFYSQYKKDSGELEVNWYEQTREGQWGQDIERADELSRAGRHLEAIGILENVKAQMTDSGERSVVDLTIASETFFGIDRQNGVELFAAIAETGEYPDMSRAYAMLAVADQFDGIQDKNLLRPFFTEQEFSSTDQSALITSLYQRIYDTHRFGLAAGKLGVAHLNKIPKGQPMSDTDYAIIMQYLNDLDINLIELETSDAFKRFIPVTLLIKAKLLRLLEDLNRPSNQSVANVYLLAITHSRTLGIPSTEQFSILFYADYLSKKKDKEQVIRLLSESLPSSSLQLDGMVINFLSSEVRIQTSLPNLYQYQLEDTEVRAAYQQITISD